MGLKLERKKKRNILLSVIYRLSKIKLRSSKKRMRLFLDLEWIFNRLAHEESFSIYNHVEHPVRICSTKFILDEIGHKETIVDLGCKNGELTSLLAVNGNTIIGLDYDDKALEVAIKNNCYTNVTYVCQEAHDFLKINTSKFDVLILSHILEHLDDPIEFLDSIKHSFKKIYVEVPDYESTYLNLYRERVETNLNYSDVDHISEFDRNEFIEMISNIDGLSIAKCEFRFGVQKYWLTVA